MNNILVGLAYIHGGQCDTSSERVVPANAMDTVADLVGQLALEERRVRVRRRGVASVPRQHGPVLHVAAAGRERASVQHLLRGGHGVRPRALPLASRVLAHALVRRLHELEHVRALATHHVRPLLGRAAGRDRRHTPRQGQRRRHHLHLAAQQGRQEIQRGSLNTQILKHQIELLYV